MGSREIQRTLSLSSLRFPNLKREMVWVFGIFSLSTWLFRSNRDEEYIHVCMVFGKILFSLYRGFVLFYPYWEVSPLFSALLPLGGEICPSLILKQMIMLIGL